MVFKQGSIERRLEQMEQAPRPRHNGHKASGHDPWPWDESMPEKLRPKDYDTPKLVRMKQDERRILLESRASSTLRVVGGTG